MTTKICRKCGVEKDSEQFSKCSKAADKKELWCRECLKERKKKWRNENPDKERAIKLRSRCRDREKGTRRGDGRGLQHRRRLKQKDPIKYAVMMFKSHLQRRYKLTISQYEAMINTHNNSCAICGRKEITRLPSGRIDGLYVDHDHKTGKVRGILCKNCNVALGLLRDSTIILSNAIDYLTFYANK